MSKEVTKKFHKYQWEVLTAEEQFVAAIAGVQGGKTHTGASWLARRIERYPKDNHLIAAPTYKILQQSTLPKFFQEFPFYREYYRKGDEVINHPSGGHIFIRSMDDPYKAEGMTLRSAWFDEGGNMKAQAWTVIQARLAIKKGQLLITTTPYNMGWLYNDFYRLWKEGDPRFRVISWSSVDNPFFPKDEFDRVRESMDLVTFEMRYMGHFKKRHGLVYPEWDNAQIISKQDMESIKKTKGLQHVVAGVDWGYSNPAAIVIIGIDNDLHYYVMEEFYEKRKTTAEIIREAKNLQASQRINTFYADSAEPDRIEEAKRNGLYVIPANKDLALGIDKVRQAVREKRLHVVAGCINFLDEIENYHYPEPGQRGYDKEYPVKDNDHLMDAARYAIFTHDPRPTDYNYVKKVMQNRYKKYIYQ